MPALWPDSRSRSDTNRPDCLGGAGWWRGNYHRRPGLAPLDPLLVDPAALAIALVVGYLTTARRDDDGSLASAGNVSVDELREGDCFNTADAVEISDVDGVPCPELHEYEVFALSHYEGDGTYPPDSALDGIFTQICEPDFEPYVGAPYATSEIYGTMISPSEESWGKDDRSFICVLFDPNEAQLTESLAGANR